MVESSYTLLYQPWCSTTPDRRHSNTVIGNFGIPFRDQEKADQKQSTPNQEHRCSCWIRDLTEACCTRWVTHAQRQSILNIPVSKFGILLDTKRGQIIRLLQIRSISEGTRSSRDLHIMWWLGLLITQIARQTCSTWYNRISVLQKGTSWTILCQLAYL